MAQVVIRNLDEEVVARLKQRAAQRKVSLEESLREILTMAARPSREERIKRLREIRAMTPPLRPGAPLAEDLIREDRDSR